MNLLKQLTIKNLKLNKKRTIVTIIGIMLSAALITSVATMYTCAVDAFTRYEIEEKGNFHVAFYDVPVEEVQIFQNNRKIENLYTSENIGYARLWESKNEYKPYVYIKAYDKNALDNLIGNGNLVRGRLPERENEILIPTHIKTNGRVNFEVGDIITLEVGKRMRDGYELNQNHPFLPTDEEGADGSEAIIDTVTKEYTIVGIMNRPSSMVENYEAPGYTCITYSKGIDEEIGEAGSLNVKPALGEMGANRKTIDVYVRYTKEGLRDFYQTTAGILGVDEEVYKAVYSNMAHYSDEEKAAASEVYENRRYRNEANSYLVSLERNPLEDNTMGELGVVAAIVCLIILFTSVFCIKNSFDISITEKVRQYGMLRSVGATKSQIRKNVYFEAGILGGIGIPLGILCGELAAFILCQISNRLLGNSFASGFVLKFIPSYLAILVAVVLSIVTIYLSALRSAWRAAGVSPIESIRSNSEIRLKRRQIRSPKLIRKLFGVGGEISFKNLKRNRRKYRTTTISITVSVFTFIALYSFMQQAFESVGMEIQTYDYNISMWVDPLDEEQYQAVLATTKLEGIREYTLKRSVLLQVSDKAWWNDEYIERNQIDREELDSISSYIVALGREQYDSYIRSLGLRYEEVWNKAILLDTTLVMIQDEKTQKMVGYPTRQYTYKKGDVVQGDVRHLEDDEPYMDISLEVAAVTEKAPFGIDQGGPGYLVVSDELYDQIVPGYHGLLIRYDAEDPDQLQDEIDELLDGYDYSLNNVNDNATTMNNIFTLVGIFLYGFITVITLIGVTNIFNTITTNMALREREFAMLKSVGMTKREFHHMIRLETVFMGTKALLYGIPIGVALSWLISHYLGGDHDMVYKLPFFAIGISVVAVFVLITCIMEYGVGKIRKQNIIETIRNENQ